MIDKKTNLNYSAGIPLMVGDRRYAQDIVRDQWFHEDRTGLAVKDIVTTIPYIFSGGVVTKGAGDTLNISAGVGYCKFSVTVPNSYAVVPPSTQSQDIDSIRTVWTAQTNLAIPSAILDGATVNYVKVQYSETDGNSRARAKKAGTYVFEKTPSFTIVVDTTPNTDYDILLNTFTGTSGGAFTFSGNSSKQKTRVLEVDNANYTILDTDGYNVIIFKNLSADRYLYLPTLADNQSRDILVINETGTYKVIVTPEGTEKINTWNATVEITEQWGWWRFIAVAGQWNGLTNGWSTVYSVSSETADTGLTIDGTWDDVEGMVLTIGTAGKYALNTKGMQMCEDTSNPTYIYLYFGLGTISGNNAPNIPDAYDYVDGITTIANTMDALRLNRKIVNMEYIITGSATVYMKAKILTNELNATSHEMYGTTNSAMYIKARRIT